MKFIVTRTGKNGDIIKTCDTAEAAFEQASALLMTDATVVTITDGDPPNIRPVNSACTPLSMSDNEHESGEAFDLRSNRRKHHMPDDTTCNEPTML